MDQVNPETVSLATRAKVMVTKATDRAAAQITAKHPGDGSLRDAVRYVMSLPVNERERHAISVPGFALIGRDPIERIAARRDFASF
jgi:hypothetical protein